MGTLIDAVGGDRWGGLRDGYRRGQLGNPSSTVGQPPSFKGVPLAPGQDVKAPKILASAARNDQGTNVCIPYARVCAAHELVGKGRLEQGDVLFLHRNLYSSNTGAIKRNQAHVNALQERVSIACQTPHAKMHNVAGLDWINAHLTDVDHLVGGRTVLLNSTNPADHWRSLSFVAEWCVDGVVMSNDSPGYLLSTTAGARNDQLFNVAVQGVTQVNNGFQDDRGKGISSHVSNLINGPFYQQYPLQMFDRKVKLLSELYVGLVCRYVDGEELAFIKERRGKSLLGDMTFKDLDQIKHIHVFEYVLFSDRQAWQLVSSYADANARGRVTYRGVHSGTTASFEGPTQYAEPASRRRGPLDHSKPRTAYYAPRTGPFHKPDANTVPLEARRDTFEGITANEVYGMVGAWKIGKVMDTASQKKEIMKGGPIDTAFRLTVNVDIAFLDWRALRRRLGNGDVGMVHVHEWDRMITMQEKVTHQGKRKFETVFEQDDGAVVQWPTTYHSYKFQRKDTLRKAWADGDVNVPLDPERKSEMVVCNGYRIHVKFESPSDLDKIVRPEGKPHIYSSLFSGAREKDDNDGEFKTVSEIIDAEFVKILQIEGLPSNYETESKIDNVDLINGELSVVVAVFDTTGDASASDEAAVKDILDRAKDGLEESFRKASDVHSITYETGTFLHPKQGQNVAVIEYINRLKNNVPEYGYGSHRKPGGPPALRDKETLQDVFDDENITTVDYPQIEAVAPSSTNASSAVVPPAPQESSSAAETSAPSSSSLSSLSSLSTNAVAAAAPAPAPAAETSAPSSSSLSSLSTNAVAAAAPAPALAPLPEVAANAPTEHPTEVVATDAAPPNKEKARPTMGVLGDEVFSSIFGGSSQTPVDSPVPSQTPAHASSGAQNEDGASDDTQRSFPRRNRDR